MADILITDLTTKDLDGTGVYDELLASTLIRIQEEYSKQRIQGSDYSKLYLGGLQAVLQQSVSFILGKQQADKQAELLVAQTANEVTNNDLILAQIAKVNAETALITQQTANAVIQGDNLLKEGTKLDAEILLLGSQNTKLTTVDTALVTAQIAKIDSDVIINGKQGLKIDAETSLIGQQEANALLQATVITNQGTKILSEISLLDQKVLTEEAQIVDRVTGAVADVTGMLGKQKDLYTAQKEGFARDAEQKLLKIMADTWSVRHSQDPTGNLEGPAGLSDSNIASVVTVAKTGVNAV